MGEITVAERLERLEQQNRRLKAGLLAVVAVVGGLLTLGMVRTPKVIEAQKFVVRDGKGVVRAMLGPADEKLRAVLGVNAKEATRSVALTLCDLKGRPLAVLEASDDHAFFGMLDAKGKPGVALVGGAGRDPSFLLSGAEGRAAVEFNLDDEGAVVQLRAPHRAGGEAWADLEVLQHGSSFDLYDGTGDPGASIRATDRERGLQVFMSRRGAGDKELWPGVAVFGAGKELPGLMIEDDKGKELFRAP